MAKDSAEEKEAPAKGGKKKMIIIAVVAVLLLGGVYKFVLAKPSAAVATEKPAPKPGPVLVIDPININLSSGALLRLGMTLQLTEGAAGLAEPLDPGKALDSAITLFSGEDIATLQSKKAVAKLKAELLHEIEERYTPEKETGATEEPESYVMDLYFTTLVVQAPTS
ncbi:flagellar basal body-associated protein FliL [Motilibacter peucedani]|uniref:Flagellar protein FliL n=1 Tax=Motilibacter peucedani TaxID=598650 RepID=A0A420XTG0_9ACTN|nr:flagellar basal body-associated FliL family protein [Motilibacter peucedani]RKS80123.1 flagellar basal body-associated protein FliL [Motilibacter peucedani]